MSTYMLSASSIIGNDVKTHTDDDIGDIKDIMMDPDTGQSSYAVLSFGGFMGIGDKYFAVPFQALTLDREDECYRLDITKERLENAPGFKKDDWPDFADPSFRTTIDGYYGLAA